MMFESFMLSILIYVAFTTFGFQTAFTLGAFTLLILMVYRKQLKIEIELQEKQRIINGFIKSQVGNREYDKIISEAFDSV